MDKFNVVFVTICCCFAFQSCKSEDLGGFSPKESKEYSFSMISNNVIYDNNNYAAFTTLTEYKGTQYVAFREGSRHGATSEEEFGGIRVLRYSNGRWESYAYIQDPEKDLRDPCFVESNGNLRIYMGYAAMEQGMINFKGSAFVDLMDGYGSKIQTIKHDLPHIAWLWKVRKYDGRYYSVAYATEGGNPFLLTSEDGIDWKTITEFKIDDYNLTEADICFVGRTMYVCLRKDGSAGDPSYWGVAEYPFTDFQWKKMESHIESPELISLPYSNSLVLAGREVTEIATYVSLFNVSVGGKLSRISALAEENGGRTSKGYPGLLFIDGNLYCSYYASYNGNCVIFYSLFLNNL